MSPAPPQGAAVVVLGPSGAALGRRVRDLLPGALLYGPRALAGDWDEGYARVVPLLAGLFAAGRPIVGLCASGILIRALAPLIDDKRTEPPVVALAEDGSVAVPLLGGHRGANALANALADALGCVAAITTAGDLRLGIALDEPPPGWHIANPERIKELAAALLAGEPVALLDEAGAADWLRAGSIKWAASAAQQVVVTDRTVPTGTAALVFHPPVLALGIGCERFCPAEEIAALAHETLAVAGLAAGAVAAIVSVELKADEPGIHALAGSFDVPARFFPAARLLAETERLTIRSEAAFRATGCWGVAEGAALAAAGPGGALVVPRRQSRHATCAIARSPAPLDACALGHARGRLAIVGIGPGDKAWRTPEASALIAASGDVVGYSPLSRPARRRDRRQAATRQRDRLRGRAGAARPRPRRRRRLGCVDLLGRPRHLRPRRPGVRADRPRGAPRLVGGRHHRRPRGQRDAGRRRPGRRPARP